MGRGLRRTLRRDVRVRSGRRSCRTALADARPARRQAALPHPQTRAAAVRLRGQSPARAPRCQCRAVADGAVPLFLVPDDARAAYDVRARLQAAGGLQPDRRARRRIAGVALLGRAATRWAPRPGTVRPVLARPGGRCRADAARPAGAGGGETDGGRRPVRRAAERRHRLERRRGADESVLHRAGNNVHRRIQRSHLSQRTGVRTDGRAPIRHDSPRSAHRRGRCERLRARDDRAARRARRRLGMPAALLRLTPRP